MISKNKKISTHIFTYIQHLPLWASYKRWRSLFPASKQKISAHDRMKIRSYQALTEHLIRSREVDRGSNNLINSNGLAQIKILARIKLFILWLTNRRYLTCSGYNLVLMRGATEYFKNVQGFRLSCAYTCLL